MIGRCDNLGQEGPTFTLRDTYWQPSMTVRFASHSHQFSLWVWEWRVERHVFTIYTYFTFIRKISNIYRGKEIISNIAMCVCLMYNPSVYPVFPIIFEANSIQQIIFYIYILVSTSSCLMSPFIYSLLEPKSK